MKILLAYLCHYKDRHDYYISLMPYGLTSIAAYLERNGFDVILANFSSIGYKKAVKYIIKEKPDVMGISIFSFNRVDSFKLICAVKKELPEIQIVAGGHHIAYLADEIIKRYPEIDYIIKGEGETAFLELLTNLAGKKISEKIINTKRIMNLDALPYPPQFSGTLIGINQNEQYKYIITTRGCPNSCDFCSSPFFWQKKVVYRTAENIIQELEYIHKKFGIIYFSIRDDNFTLKKDRVLQFCTLLQKSGMYLMWNCQARVDTIDEEMLIEMKRAGLEHIQYGVESGSVKILQMYNKSITIDDIRNAARLTRKVGIYLSIYIMVGMLNEKHSDIQKTIALIKQILPGDGIVSPVALYPGTPLYNDMKSKGLIHDSVWFNKDDSGIFVRNDKDVNEWMKAIMNSFGMIRDKSWYKPKDFENHKDVMGKECWVTDILEGDYYLDEEMYDRAEVCYSRVTNKYAGNLWGYLRMGKLKFIIENYKIAEENYKQVTTIVPSYYGGWLKLAESKLALGKHKEAKECINKAYTLNAFDIRVKNFMTILK